VAASLAENYFGQTSIACCRNLSTSAYVCHFTPVAVIASAIGVPWIVCPEIEV